MIYTERDKLTIYQLGENTWEVPFSDLAPICLERPANIVYCVKENKLEGIISVGDIHRAAGQKESVTVNRSFSKVTYWEYMKAR